MKWHWSAVITVKASVPGAMEEKVMWVWYPGTGKVEPLTYRGWWVYYPTPSRSTSKDATEFQKLPEFQVGDLVRLRGKPERIRRVLQVEWHSFRYEYVYIVETANGFSAYWFGPQLLPAGG